MIFLWICIQSWMCARTNAMNHSMHGWDVSALGEAIYALLHFFNNDTVQRGRSQHAYTCANPTPMSTSEVLSTGTSGDSRSHQWRLVVDGNVTYQLTHNAGKSWKIHEKVRAPGFELWWVASHWTVLPLDYKPTRLLHFSCSPLHF
jgi:hypothetical protein